MIDILTTYPSSETMIIVWLVIVILGLVLEGATTELVSIYFSLGALVSMFLAIFGVPFWPQVWTFVIVVILSLLTTRPIFLKYLKTNEIKTNVDSLVGKRFKLIKAITAEQRGEVNVYGVVWNVITNDNSSIDINETVEVLSLDGSKLIVKKI